MKGDFLSQYNKHVIQIGFNGSLAWIFCEKFDWKSEDYKQFHKELIDLYELVKGLDVEKVSMPYSDDIENSILKSLHSDFKDIMKKIGLIVPITSMAQNILWTSVIASSSVVAPVHYFGLYYSITPLYKC